MRAITRNYWYLLIIVALGVMAVLTWANFRYASQNPGGNDFLVHWVGTRSLFLDGVSPYSEEVAIQIQTLAYGRPALPGEHELRVAYPIYSALIFLPFALISDFTLARALWMTALEVGLISLALISLELVRWRMKPWWLALFLVLSILWYHGLRPLINGNAVILVAVMLVAALLALRSRRYELAGVFLSLATIKPHLVILPIIFILIWTLSQRRWQTLAWLAITVGLLSAGFAFFVPDWPLQNLHEILRYSSYNPPGTPAAVLAIWLPNTGARLGWALSTILGVMLLIEWWLAHRQEFPWFLWTACLTLVISQWIGIQTDPGNFILLFLPLVLVLSIWSERWGRRGEILVGIILLLLLVVPWVVFLQTVTFGDQPLQHPVMFLPLPAFLLIGLYWVRWWAIRPKRLLVDELKQYDSQR